MSEHTKTVGDPRTTEQLRSLLMGHYGPGPDYPTTWIAGMAEAFVEFDARRSAEIATLTTALEQVALLAGQTLLGPDSKHHMGEDATLYHEMGANAAFEQAASIAADALTNP